MPGRASALAVLGLGPDADAAAIDQAYRRLIKQFHPDREGGDGVRAAEIIHAYRELRGGKALVDPLQFNEDLSLRRPRRRRWPTLFAFLLLAGSVAAIIARPDLLPRLSAVGRSAGLNKVVREDDVIDAPLHENVIQAAVLQARALYLSKDEFALSGESRNCQQRFRKNPNIEQLDRCAAFDNAVVGLRDRDPLRDGGPFSPLAVTGRQWSAASSLSDDYIAIDSRLDRIRLQVELALAAIQSRQTQAATSAERPPSTTPVP